MLLYPINHKIEIRSLKPGILLQNSHYISLECCVWLISFVFHSTSSESEWQLHSWWSWAGNSVWRWGKIRRPNFPPFLLLLWAWKSTFTSQKYATWSTSKELTQLRSCASLLPRSAVSNFPIVWFGSTFLELMRHQVYITRALWNVTFHRFLALIWAQTEIRILMQKFIMFK